MKGGDTLRGNFGHHAEYTIVLHKHVRGAKQVSTPDCRHHVSLFLIMLGPVCRKMSRDLSCYNV